jgi:sialate O-acetylesterase
MKTLPLYRTALLPSLAVLAMAASAAFAAVTPASPFTSHMVLQREMAVPIWGRAEPGEKVTVEFEGKTKTTRAGSDGKWSMELAAMPASAEGRPLTITGSKSPKPIVLDDVLVGEVWVASGQSNMAFTVSKAFKSWAGLKNEEQEIAAANHPEIRMFNAKETKTYEPQARVDGEWLVCSPENVPGFSAIGYFFARALQKELNVPVGILHLSHGASTPQAWIRRETVATDPQFKPFLDEFDTKVKAFVPPTNEAQKTWQQTADAAKAAGKKEPKKPWSDPVQDQHNPTVLFNGMVAPVLPYAIRGVIWYQGESITGAKELFPSWNAALIKDWRTLWGHELPFLFCQLAAHHKASNSPEVRELQTEALAIPGTGMAVTIDIGDAKNIHPKNKQDVGDRLARIALAKTYGRDIESSGPLYESMNVEDGAIRLKFSHLGGGLVTKNEPLETFEIAGADGKFVPAEAKIEGNTIVVRSAEVPSPTIARYAWANDPTGCNLYNKADLPAAPFRTDKTH